MHSILLDNISRVSDRLFEFEYTIKIVFVTWIVTNTSVKHTN